MKTEEDSDLKVLIIDDKAMIRELVADALAEKYGFRVTSTGMNDPDGLKQAFSKEQDIVLLDIDMAGFDVPRTVRSILSFQPAARVLVMASDIRLPDIAPLFESGAVGFIHKKSAFREILLAMRAVIQDKFYISPFIRQHMIPLPALPRKDAPLEALSLRQREVLALIARGKPVKEIAFNLNLSVSTVNLHRRNLEEKLGLDSVADLKKYAIRKGLISAADGIRSLAADEDLDG